MVPMQMQIKSARNALRTAVRVSHTLTNAKPVQLDNTRVEATVSPQSPRAFTLPVPSFLNATRVETA